VDQDILKQKLTGVFRSTFFQPALEIREGMTAHDVEGWDSLSHINLVLAIEQEFGISLTTRDVRSMKNVGDLLQLVARKAVSNESAGQLR
jgi:acyl carrier protein